MKITGPALLARYLALAWGALVVYGSLHPFTGWRTTGASPLAYLEGGWPRYWTVFDVITNVAVYAPLGFLLTLALVRLPWRWLALLLAVLLSAALSCALEALQTWLPSRVPSNLDLGCNTLGAFCGAGLALFAGPRFFERVAAWQSRLVAPIRHAELGLTLLGLWLLVPVSPEILLFGAGDVRHVFDLSGVVPFAPPSFQRIETAVTALNAVAVGLLLRTLLADRATAFLAAPIVLGVGLLIRALSASILVGPENAFGWLTPGAKMGLAASLLALAVTLPLPALPRQIVAVLVLAAGTVLVNLAPPNPYSVAALSAWRQGHFLNFNGLTRWVSILWPFLALPYLLVAGRRE